MLLITGGAGFIGANFVLGWLAGSDEPVINLDKLGNLCKSPGIDVSVDYPGSRGIQGVT